MVLLSYAAYALVGIGLLALGMGLRGKKQLTAPHCAGCSYDLRAMNFMSGEAACCPECGANLSGTAAVIFGRYTPDRRVLVLGLALVCLGVAGEAAPRIVPKPRTTPPSAVAFPGFAAAAARPVPSTQSVIQLCKQLSTDIRSPMVWNELQGRLQRKSLYADDVKAVVEELVRFSEQTQASHQPMPQLGEMMAFIGGAIQQDLMNSEVIHRYCDAYCKHLLELRGQPRVRAGEPLILGIDDVPEFHGNNYLSDMIWSLSEVNADGKYDLEASRHYWGSGPVKPNRDDLSGRFHSGVTQIQIPQSLPIGQHELYLVFDIGVLPRGAGSWERGWKPGEASKWPRGYASWRLPLKYLVTVVPADQSLVTLIEDSERDPFKKFQISIADCTAKHTPHGVDISISWKHEGRPTVCIGYKVELLAGEQRIHFGFFTMFPSGGGGYSGTAFRTTLDRSVTKLDVLLTPSPQSLEQELSVHEIWGKPQTIHDVPVRWLDGEQ